MPRIVLGTMKLWYNGAMVCASLTIYLRCCYIGISAFANAVGKLGDFGLFKTENHAEADFPASAWFFHSAISISICGILPSGYSLPYSLKPNLL